MSDAAVDGRRPFTLTRAILGLGVGALGGVFLSQLALGLIDGWANVGPGNRLSIGLGVLVATVCLPAGVVIAKDTDRAWKQRESCMGLAIFGACIFAAFLSGSLLRGSWDDAVSVAVMVGGLALFTASVVIAMRADARPNQSETVN